MKKPNVQICLKLIVSGSTKTSLSVFPKLLVDLIMTLREIFFSIPENVTPSLSIKLPSNLSFPFVPMFVHFSLPLGRSSIFRDGKISCAYLAPGVFLSFQPFFITYLLEM